MVGDFPAFEGAALFHNYLARIYQLLQVGSVVDHLVGAAQCRVFIFEHVEAVRAGGNYFLYIIAVQQLDIIISHHLEQKFIAGPARGISRTHLLLSHDGKGNAYFIQDLCECFGYFLSSLVKTAGTAYPE